MTETSARIRWEDKIPGNNDVYNVASIGYVGTVEESAFIIYTPDEAHAGWLLSVRLVPGSKFIYGASPEEMKSKAERWLKEFVTSLGTAFPAGSSDEDEARQAPPAKRPVLTSMYVFDVLYSAGFTPWGSGGPGFTTGWHMDALTVDHVGADLPVHGPLEGPRAIIAGYAQTLDEAGFDTHITVNTVLVRKKAAANPAPAGEKE